MDLKKAKEVAKHELEKASIVVVTSNSGIFLLEKEEEIKVVEEYAKNNKLGCFVVKNGKEVSENAAEDVTAEEKPKKKK
jgi:hypothetical protein